MNEPNRTDPDKQDLLRAPGLAVLGLVTLAIAGWALTGGPSLPDAKTIGIIAVTVGLIAGVGLIVVGTRSSR